jgi:pimeloyl-ACP methyl ester carboxylesterase
LEVTMLWKRRGSGPPVLLLPGLGCDERLWEPVAEALEGSFTLFLADFSGCDTLREVAVVLARRLSEAEAAPAGVAGLSMGGYVALELLRHAPEAVCAAALLDTTAFADSPERQRSRREVLHRLDQGCFEDVLAAFVASVLSPDYPSHGPARALLSQMARELGADSFRASTEAILKRGSYEDVLRWCRVPLLFLVGEHDVLTPPEVARRMAAEVPGAGLEVVPRAGHLTPLEAPDRVAELLGAFFRRHCRRG